MQTDPSTGSATTTDRRTFLARTLIGSGIAAGALVLPVQSLLTQAGAQDGDAANLRGTLKDEDFAAFAAPLELSAIQAYNAALTSQKLDREWTVRALNFQSHHQAVVDALVALGDPNAEAPEPDSDFAKAATDAVDAASDQAGVLVALANVEDILAATHLAAISELVEPSTAKTVTQVLSVEGQQAALLTVGAGRPVPEATPPTGTDDAAIVMPDPSTTTTTSTTSTTAASSDSSDSSDSTTTTEAN